MRRDLAGRAVLLAAGVGTALGAGAGLASAAPLEQDLQQDPSGLNAFDQPADLPGVLPQAPNLSLTDGLTQTQATKGLDLATVSGDSIAGLGTNGLLSGVGSNGGNAGGATADSGAADNAATDATGTDAGSTDGSSTDTGSGQSG